MLHVLDIVIQCFDIIAVVIDVLIIIVNDMR